MSNYAILFAKMTKGAAGLPLFYDCCLRPPARYSGPDLPGIQSSWWPDKAA